VHPIVNVNLRINALWSLMSAVPWFEVEGRGGYTTSWHKVDSNQRGALDDSCQQAQFKSAGPQQIDTVQSALYCKGNVNIQRGDSVTLKVDK